MASVIEQSATSILLFGQDKNLVDTRRWVLEKAGFRVSSAMSSTDLSQIAEKERISLFLLCASLEAEARDGALNYVRVRWPDARRLVVMPFSCSTEFEPTEEVFSALEGPEKLVEVIRTLTVSARSSATSGLSA